MTSSLQTSVTVFILRIKVLYKWNSCSCYSTEVKALKWIKRIKGIMTKMKQDISAGTWKWRHLDVVLFNSSFLALLHLHHYSAARILRAIICQFGITFIKWTAHFVRKKTQQWQQLFSISKFALKLEKRRFTILLVVGDISPEVVLSSFIDFKLKYFTWQVFSLLWQCPYNIDTPKVKEDCGTLLWENNMCSRKTRQG